MSTILFWLKITVSSWKRHGRSTPIATTEGMPGSTSVAVGGLVGSGLPKSGAGTSGPTGFHPAKFLTTRREKTAGSMSPEMMTTARLGRYHRSWNALSAAPVAPVSVFSVPIGERSASG